MKSESEELLSLFVDGEDVDPDALAAALAEPDAADLLVQYARVHSAVRNADAVPSDAFYERMRLKLRPRRAIRWRAPLAAAAAILLSVAGGIWIGSSMVPARTVSVPVAVQAPGTQPSVAAPAAATGPQVGTIVPANCPAVGPPKPNRVVQFVPRDVTNPGASGGGNRP